MAWRAAVRRMTSVEHLRESADWFRSSGIPLNSVHSPLYADYEFGRAGAPPVNVASTDRAGRIEAMDEIKRALEIAEQIPLLQWNICARLLNRWA